MQKKNIYKQIIQNRLQGILKLIGAEENAAIIEREIALLALDVLNALQNRTIVLKEGCRCFIRIEYALPSKLEGKLSEDVMDLLNEGVILDEVGSIHGPDINLMRKLATRILNREAQATMRKGGSAFILATTR